MIFKQIVCKSSASAYFLVVVVIMSLMLLLSSSCFVASLEAPQKHQSATSLLKRSSFSSSSSSSSSSPPFSTSFSSSSRCLYFSNLSGRLLAVDEKGDWRLQLAQNEGLGRRPRGLTIDEASRRLFVLHEEDIRVIYLYKRGEKGSDEDDVEAADKEGEKEGDDESSASRKEEAEAEQRRRGSYNSTRVNEVVVHARPLVRFGDHLGEFYCNPQGLAWMGEYLYVACEHPLPFGILRFRISDGSFAGGAAVLIGLRHLLPSSTKEAIIAAPTLSHNIYSIAVNGEDTFFTYNELLARLGLNLHIDIDEESLHHNKTIEEGEEEEEQEEEQEGIGEVIYSNRPDLITKINALNANYMEKFIEIEPGDLGIGTPSHEYDEEQDDESNDEDSDDYKHGFIKHKRKVTKSYGTLGGMTYGRNNTRLYVVLAMPEYFFNLGAPTGRVLEFDVATGELLAYSAPLLSPFDVKIGPNGNLFVTEMFLSSRYSSILELTASSFSRPPSTLCNSTIQRPMEPLYAAWGPCPPTTIIREPEGSSGDGDEVTSAERLLSIILPVMFSLLLVGAAFFLGFWANGCWKRRRREYEVKDRTDDGDDYEIGRTGKSRFTFAMIDPEELRVGQLLGCGAFGKVYKGMWRGAEVAIKTFNDFDLDSADEKTILEIKEEAQMMERLSKHPNVVKFIGVVMQKKYHHHNEDLKNDLNNNVDLSFALILEYCPFGSLYDVVVKRKQRLPLVTLLRVARDIAAGILHLHKENVIHRDIAARNVLVGENFSVYISDFGMARAKQTDINVTSSNLGPVKWMAPEAMLKRQYSEASDAFSFGVLLWELVTCNVPWRGLAGSQVILAVAKNNTRLKIPGDCDPILKKIIKSVWEDRPEKRMTFTEIVRRLSAHHDALAHLYGEDQAAAEDDALSYLCESPRRTSDDTVSASNSSDDEEEDLTTITPTHSTNTPTTETPSSSSPLNELRLSDSYAIMVNSSIPQFSQDFVGDPSSISSSSADEAAAIMTTKKHNDKKHKSKRRKEMLTSSLAISGQPNMDDIISYRL